MRACYDCGRDDFEVFEEITNPLPGEEGKGDLLVCRHCNELVYESERVGFWRALGRRFAFRFHSNTADAMARGPR